MSEGKHHSLKMKVGEYHSSAVLHIYQIWSSTQVLWWISVFALQELFWLYDQLCNQTFQRVVVYYWIYILGICILALKVLVKHVYTDI